MNTSKKLLIIMLSKMWRIRHFEHAARKSHESGEIVGSLHSYVGQEGVAVGACAALRDSDYIAGNHRSHGHPLAKGGDVNKAMAEIFGKKTGYCKGKGGSMHLIDTSRGIMGMSAVVATTIPQAAGYAYALKLRKQKNIVVSFFGDGATEEGVFHETLNFAALKKLPMIFVCENNQYAVLSHQSERQSSSNITERAAVYDMHSEKIRQNDAQAIYEKINWARNQIVEKGEGPIFFECMTERYREHVGPNERDDIKTRSAEINDPLEQLSKLVSSDFKEDVSKEVDLELKEAIDFADKSSFPSNDTLYQDVYA